MNITKAEKLLKLLETYPEALKSLPSELQIMERIGEALNPSLDPGSVYIHMQGLNAMKMNSLMNHLQHELNKNLADTVTIHHNLPEGLSDDFTAMHSTKVHLTVDWQNPTPEGWELTNGNASCLQFGRRLSELKWEYREWVDHPAHAVIGFSLEDKVADWDNHMWRSRVIDLEEYSSETIENAVAQTGLNWFYFENSFLIEQENAEESAKLACGILFSMGY